MSVRGDGDVAVIGGGVVGMCMAHGLSGAGLAVTVLDEGDVAFRASRGNFALVWVRGKGLEMPAYARWTMRSSELWHDFAAGLADETGIDAGLTKVVDGAPSRTMTGCGGRATSRTMTGCHGRATSVAIMTRQALGLAVPLVPVAPS